MARSGTLPRLADDSPVLIWMQDGEGHRFVNRAYLEFVGIAEADVQETAWQDHLHPDDRAEYLRALDHAMARRELLEAQARVRRFDSEYRWMKHVVRPQVDESDRLTGHVGSAVDIQDLKSAEELLRHADRNKNQFLAMLGHELRNPLVPLRNAVDLLRAPELDRATLAWVRDMLDRQTRAISRMVDDLLDISQITEGRTQLQRDAVDLCTAHEFTSEGVDAAAPRVDRPRRVLIADDNVDASDALARLLRKAGHEVEVVHRGDEVIAVACRMHPDAVLLDLGLPGRDGYQVARDLRALPETANVLLLAVTGYGGAQEREQTRLAGFDFHYTKPLEFNVLAEALCGDPIR